MAAELLVVTPTLGDSPFLHETASSVRQVVGGAQHVLVTPAGRVDRLRAQFPHCAVIAEPTGAGLYGALNHAIATCQRWDWFTYINDDDTLLPGFARVVAAHCVPDMIREIAYTDVMFTDVRGRSLGVAPVERNSRRLAGVMRSGVLPLAQPGSIVGRPLLAQLRGFDTQYRHSADFDLWVRAIAAGVRLRYYAEVAGTYRVRHGQLSGEVNQTVREVAASTRILGAPMPIVTAACIRGGFYVRNLGRYLQRVMRSGRLRSRSLFANPPR